jgi:hypothetical protein
MAFETRENRLHSGRESDDFLELKLQLAGGLEVWMMVQGLHDMGHDTGTRE